MINDSILFLLFILKICLFFNKKYNQVIKTKLKTFVHFQFFVLDVW